MSENRTQLVPAVAVGSGLNDQYAQLQKIPGLVVAI
jgi:hypothetical protein